jgi:hypothetical protein
MIQSWILFPGTVPAARLCVRARRIVALDASMAGAAGRREAEDGSEAYQPKYSLVSPARRAAGELRPGEAVREQPIRPDSVTVTSPNLKLASFSLFPVWPLTISQATKLFFQILDDTQPVPRILMVSAAMAAWSRTAGPAADPDS